VGCIAAWARGALATLEIGLGNYAAGLTAIQAANEDAWIRTRLLPDLVETATRVGDRRLAAAAVDELAAVTIPAGTPWALGVLARSQALTAKASHQEMLYRQAIDHLGRSRVTPQLARARLLYGEWLRRKRRRVDAREQLGAAHVMFSSMGAEAFAHRALTELHATGGAASTRPSPSAHTEALTAQEARIAALAGEGLSNAEIGAQLFVSRRTVEYHLHKIYRKLDVGSRTRLAALLRLPERALPYQEQQPPAVGVQHAAPANGVSPPS
jgi:DNA-binding CsgD family transcriptional regulator